VNATVSRRANLLAIANRCSSEHRNSRQEFTPVFVIQDDKTDAGPVPAHLPVPGIGGKIALPLPDENRI